MQSAMAYDPHLHNGSPSCSCLYRRETLSLKSLMQLSAALPARMVAPAHHLELVTVLSDGQGNCVMKVPSFLFFRPRWYY